MSNDKTVKKALALLRSGEKSTDVAKALGVNTSTVYSWIKKANVGKLNVAKPNGAHKDAILYLRHAEAAMLEEVRAGKRKRLSKANLLALLALSTLGGCATTASYQPVVDLQGKDLGQYQQNLADCKMYAAGRDPAQQGLVGMFVGGMLGAALGDRTTMRNGAIIGATTGIGHGAQQQFQIVEKCLEGRGYHVLSQ